MLQRTITLCLSLLLAVCCLAKKPVKQPTVSDLEKQRKATLNQINNTQRLIQETQKNEKATVNKLTLLNKSIKERKTLIDGISTEVQALDGELQVLGRQKDSLATRLSLAQADYARLVRSIYYSRSTGNWFTFVLSASTFNELFQRILYLRQVAQWRKRQALVIRGLREEVTQNETHVRNNRRTKNEVLNQHKQEHAALVSDEKKQNTMLSQLKKQEKNLSAQQKKQQAKVAQINARIEKMIAQEIARQEAEAKKKAAAEAAKKAAAEAKNNTAGNSTAATSSSSKTSTSTTKPTASTSTTKTTVAPASNTSKTSTASSSAASSLTKEQQLLAGGFVANKGRMPWPVERGVIVGNFGVQAHPTLQHVTINNKGIYIQAPAGSTARAIYEGVVTQRFSIPGSNNAVIVQHGNYRTVYANLTDIYVSVGQKVSAKQKIGKIYTDHENDNKTELYFQIWQDRSVINPAPWLAR